MHAERTRVVVGREVLLNFVLLLYVDAGTLRVIRVSVSVLWRMWRSCKGDGVWSGQLVMRGCQVCW